MTSKKAVSCGLYTIAFLLIATGISIRLFGLGKWPMAIDEYYMYQSVRNLLSHGLPEFECGGFYTRGLILQYAIAAVSFLDLGREFSLRIIPVTLNVLTLPAVYLISKRCSNNMVATVSVILFCLSLWEIEFSRFARMYAPFQFLFIWEVYFLLKFWADGKSNSIAWMCFLAVISIFMYEGAIFAVLLLLIPLYRYRNINAIKYIFSFTIILFLAYLFIKTDFRHMGAGAYLPPDYQSHVESGSGNNTPVVLPVVFLGQLVDNTSWLVPFLVLFVMSMVYGIKSINISHTDIMIKLVLIITIVLSALNLFFLVFTVVAVHLFLRDGKEYSNTHTGTDSSKYIFLLSLLFLFFVFYGTFGYSWVHDGSMITTARLHDTLVALIKYPDYLNKVIWLLYETMPVMIAGFMLATALYILITKVKKERLNTYISLLLAVLLIQVVEVSLIKTKFSLTRYLFYFYPLIIIIFCNSLYYLTSYTSGKKQVIYSTFLLLVLLLAFNSNEYGIKHLSGIASQETNFRVNYSKNMKMHYYPREDYRTPAEYINENRAENDKVVQLVPVVDAYMIDKPDYYYTDYKFGEFTVLSACRGTREIWTNVPLLYKESQLLDLINRNPENIWLIMSNSNSALVHGLRNTDLKRHFEHAYSGRKVYTNLDKTIDVYYIPKGTESLM